MVHFSSTSMDDEQLTLADVLAFIDTSTHDDLPLDCFGDDALTLLLPFDDDAELLGSGALRAPTAAAEAITEPSARHAARKKKVYPRRDLRKEIAQLRTDAGRLQGQLSLLRQWRPRATRRVAPYHTQHRQLSGARDAAQWTDTHAQEWMEKTIVEIARREQAEQMNADLKASLVQQLRVSRALGSLLHGGESAVVHAVEHRLEKISDGQQLFTQLYHYLEALYNNTSFIVDKLSHGSDDSGVTSSNHSQLDSTLGLTFECSTSTVVLCDVHTLESLLWGRMLTNTVTHECHQFEDKTHSRRQRADDAIEKHVQLALHGDQFGELTLKGTSVARKFASDGRMVVVFTTRSLCSETGVQLRIDCWVIVTSVADGTTASPMTRLQAFNRVHLDHSSSSRPQEPSRELQEFVVKSASERMRKHQQLLQQTLVMEFGRT